MTRLEFKLMFATILSQSNSKKIPQYFIFKLDSYDFLLKAKLKIPEHQRNKEEITLLFQKRSHIRMMLRAKREISFKK